MIARTLAFLLLLASTAGSLTADVVVLKGEGQVQGEIVPSDDPAQTTIQVKLRSGGLIAIEKSQIKELIPQNPAEKEYAQIAPGFDDTAEAQWKLAEWCREHSLNRQRQTHLERVIELDPDHVEARRALGFGKIEGRWVRQDQLMEERGYKRYKGKWMLPQEIELLEQRNKQDVAEADWLKKMKIWRGWLASRDRAQVAKENISAIKDPNAVPALAAALLNEKSSENCALFIEVLSNIGTPAALKTLVACSLEDNDKEVRVTALEALVPRRCPEIVELYVPALRPKEGDHDASRINRAGLALGYLKDPSAVGPLIEALNTTHKETISQGNPGQTSATFGGSPGNSSGGGISVGSKAVHVLVHTHNEEVLNALVNITGVNFSFDVDAWRRWFAAQKKSMAIDARRDNPVGGK